ncbi:Fc.00g079880.m01.CDS01 [Cosmosporella sp. VM-42]
MVDELVNTITDSSVLKVKNDQLIKQINTLTDEVAFLIQRKLAVTRKQVENIISSNKLGGKPGLKASLWEFVLACETRNREVLAYNNAIPDVYVQIKKRLIFSAITRHQLRDDTGSNVLRKTKYSALALRFWGLRERARFSGPNLPNLLSTVGEMETRMDVLARKFESIRSRLASFSLATWPSHSNFGHDFPGIVYKLSKNELHALKCVIDNPEARYLHTVAVTGPKDAVTVTTPSSKSLFAGRSSRRISSARCWIPCLRVMRAEASLRRLQIELLHQGNETIIGPDNKAWAFQHSPLHLAMEYDWRLVSR